MAGIRNRRARIGPPGWGKGAGISGPLPLGNPWTFRHRFNGADGDIVVSNDEIGGEVLTLSGDAKLRALGAIEGTTSLYLDGTGDAAAIADSDKWSFDGPFSLFCKFNADVLSGTLMAQSQSTATLKSWWFYHGAGGGLGLVLSANGTTDSFTLTSASGLLVAGQTYEAGVDRDASGTVRMYLNGSMIAKATFVPALFNSSIPFRIGARGSASPQNLHTGEIDDVRLCKGQAACGSDLGYIYP